MILAADPGLHGAFAAYTGDTLALRDMPTITRQVGARRVDRLFPDEIAIVGHLKGAAIRGYRLVIEQVGGIPGQSAPAAFQFGAGYGFICGAAMALGMPVERVPPMTWKSALKVPADKKAAISRATELLPQFAHLWAIERGRCNLQQASGRAEAALLALYGHQILGVLS